MGFFSKRDKGVRLPANVAQMMERAGRFEFDPQSSAEGSGAIWSETQQPLASAAREDPEGFMTALANAVVPVGGWSAYGAARTVTNLISSPDPASPAYNALMRASLEFLRGSGVPSGRLSGIEWSYWIDNGGTAETWHR